MNLIIIVIEIIRIFVSVHSLYDPAGPFPTPSHPSPDLEHLLAITKVGTERFGKIVLVSRVLGKRAGDWYVSIAGNWQADGLLLIIVNSKTMVLKLTGLHY